MIAHFLKSHYLKFYSSIDNETQRNQRIVSVIIKFDNGIMIRRETKINFLKVTQSDRYSSKLDIFKGEEKYENCPNSKISELVFDRIYLNNNLNLLNINLLGQESMNRFIRSAPYFFSILSVTKLIISPINSVL